MKTVCVYLRATTHSTNQRRTIMTTTIDGQIKAKKELLGILEALCAVSNNGYITAKSAAQISGIDEDKADSMLNQIAEQNVADIVNGDENGYTYNLRTYMFKAACESELEKLYTQQQKKKK